MQHLLRELDFYAGMLYVAHQMSLPLMFGPVQRAAVIDFVVILDTLSGACRVCICVDTRWATLAAGSTTLDTVAQTVAEHNHTNANTNASTTGNLAYTGKRTMDGKAPPRCSAG